MSLLREIRLRSKSIFDPRYRGNDIAQDVQLGNVVLGGKNCIHSGCEFAGDISIGYATTLGPRCVLRGGRISIGKYVQCGSAVAAYASDHPFTHISNYVNRNLFDGRIADYARKSSLVVNNDVWIGHGAILLNGIVVGDGAVVGGGTVVVDDVPPYSIVVGNPAKIIRYRFSNEIIRLLLQLKWWDLSQDQLKLCEPLFYIDEQKDSIKFRDCLNQAVERIFKT